MSESNSMPVVDTHGAAHHLAHAGHQLVGGERDAVVGGVFGRVGHAYTCAYTHEIRKISSSKRTHGNTHEICDVADDYWT